MTAPLVSIVIPTFNRADLLPRALASVEAQTVTDWEVVIVDDGSTDHIAEVLASWSARLGSRLRCLYQGNAGPSAARNAGLDVCRGAFVGFLDADDEFLPTKLARQLRLFQLRPELGLVYGDYAFRDAHGTAHDSVWATKSRTALRVPHEEIEPGLCAVSGSLFDWLIREYFIATIVGLVRRDLLESSVRFDESLRYAEEWLFYLHLSRRCPAGFVNEPLCLHHHVPGSTSRTSRRANTINLCRTLEAIARAFPDAGATQRAALRRQLADTHRQAGYDAYRDGDFPGARRSLARSMRWSPRPRVVFHWFHAVLNDAFHRCRQPIPPESCPSS